MSPAYEVTRNETIVHGKVCRIALLELSSKNRMKKEWFMFHLEHVVTS